MLKRKTESLPNKIWKLPRGDQERGRVTCTQKHLEKGTMRVLTEKTNALRYRSFSSCGKQPVHPVTAH
jgi:hypothetical protein